MRNFVPLILNIMAPKTDTWQDSLAALLAGMGGTPETAETAESQPSLATPVEQARLDIVYERKGRAGKSATIITGFTIDDDAVAALASELKRTLGTGGSARGGEILIQGDRRQDVLRFLTQKGLKARII